MLASLYFNLAYISVLISSCTCGGYQNQPELQNLIQETDSQEDCEVLCCNYSGKLDLSSKYCILERIRDSLISIICSFVPSFFCTKSIPHNFNYQETIKQQPKDQKSSEGLKESFDTFQNDDKSEQDLCSALANIVNAMSSTVRFKRSKLNPEQTRNGKVNRSKSICIGTSKNSSSNEEDIIIHKNSIVTNYPADINKASTKTTPTANNIISSSGDKEFPEIYSRADTCNRLLNFVFCPDIICVGECNRIMRSQKCDDLATLIFKYERSTQKRFTSHSKANLEESSDDISEQFIPKIVDLTRVDNRSETIASKIIPSKIDLHYMVPICRNWSKDTTENALLNAYKQAKQMFLHTFCNSQRTSTQNKYFMLGSKIHIVPILYNKSNNPDGSCDQVMTPRAFIMQTKKSTTQCIKNPQLKRKVRSKPFDINNVIPCISEANEENESIYNFNW